MKKWLGTGILVAVLIILALTSSLWLEPILAFLGANSDVIQSLESMIQIILCGAALLAIIFGWRRISKEEPTRTAVSRTEIGVEDDGVFANEKSVAVGEGVGVRGDVEGPVILGERNVGGDVGSDVDMSDRRVEQKGKFNVNIEEATDIRIGDTYVDEQHIHPPEEIDVDAFEASYLSFLIEQAGKLSLEGIDPKAASEAERLSLSAVYTALLTMSPEAHERLERGEMVQRKDIRRSSALRELNEHKHLVLLGDPGSGKTTFINFVTMCLAGDRMEREDVNLQTLTAPLPNDDGENQDEHQPWDQGHLLPLRIILRDLAARGSLPPAGQPVSIEHLWEFIRREMGENGKLGVYTPYLRRHLKDYGGIILFDGLDEVPEADERRQQIIHLVEQTKTAFRKCRILVTSRTYAYRRQDWELSGFSASVLAPFSRGQIIRFVDRWYTHIAPLRGISSEDARGRAQLLKHAIFASDRLQVLAERPLLLTLMASLHAWRGGSLPEKREQLYNDVVDLLLDWWEGQRVVRDEKGGYKLIQPGLAEYLKVDRDKLRRELNKLAYDAHARQPELVGTADIAQDELVGVLMHISTNRDIRPQRLMEYLRDRAGLLVPRGVGVYTFPHRTFQEYLAACHLSDEEYPVKIAEFARNDPDRWREAVLLAGAKAARGARSTIWLLTETLCSAEPPEDEKAKPSPEDLWGSFLAGQTLLENLDLDEVSSEVYRKKFDRVRYWLPHVMRADDLLVPEDRTAAGDVLAHLGDPRFRADACSLPDEPLLGFVEIPAGPFQMGSDEYSSERPPHSIDLQTFYVARYPTTVAQFQAFVDATDFEPGSDNALQDPASRPVRYVTWHEALAYCNWLTETLKTWEHTPEFLVKRLAQGWRFTLPTEAQWEKAARGEDGRTYPWGKDTDNNKANYGDTGIGVTSAVGCFPGGKSPFGVEDMSGNVWEWCLSKYEKYPYKDDRRNRIDKSRDSRVVRGGAFYLNVGSVRCAFRYGRSPPTRYDYSGFRVVFSPSTSAH